MYDWSFVQIYSRKIPVFPASDWSVVRIYPHFLRLIGPTWGIYLQALHYGVIVAALGVRYRSYCSNVSRTYLVDPTKTQQEVRTLDFYGVSKSKSEDPY